MVYFCSKNLRYEIEPIPESMEGDTILFRITKTVFGDETLTIPTGKNEFFKRLKVGNNGDVYTSKKETTPWFNLLTHKVYKHFSLSK